MTTPAQEISSIDFESMIGGPLIAVVKAQAQAAATTVGFIKQAGFKQLPEGSGEKKPANPWESAVGEPIYVKFMYNRLIKPWEPAKEGGEDKLPEYKEMELSVPLLTMIPIPYIRVADTTIAFKAKIDSMQHTATDSSLNVSGEANAKFDWLWGSVQLKVATSYQRSSKEESQTTSSYSLDINVHAVQDEMPGGLERLLGILESATEGVPKPKTP